MLPITGLRRLLNRPRTGNAPISSFSRVELIKENGQGLGDQLSAVVVGRILAYCNHMLDEETGEPGRLLAAGPILHLAQDGDTVWGTGIGRAAESDHRFRSLDVRAVRGPITGDLLARRGIAAPEIYGDPVLLLPRLFPGRFRASDRRPYVIVPGSSGMAAFAGEANAVSPLLPWNTCIERILEASFVISDALPGLAIAEAFGIPARHLSASGAGDRLAFDDYFLGTGRDRPEPAESIEQALEMGGVPPPVFDEDALLGAFPIDLWRDRRRTTHERAAS